MVLEPDTGEESAKKEGYKYLKMSDKGIPLCPAGYELLRHDEKSYRCEGGAHIYHIDNMEIIHDKYGNVMVKPNAKADEAEKNGRN